MAQPFRFLFQKQKVVGSNPIGGTALMFGPAPIARILRVDSGIRLRRLQNAAIAAGPNINAVPPMELAPPVRLEY